MMNVPMGVAVWEFEPDARPNSLDWSFLAADISYGGRAAVNPGSRVLAGRSYWREKFKPDLRTARWSEEACRCPIGFPYNPLRETLS